MEIRPILAHDNSTIAKIIRDSLMEFGAAKPGTVYFDATTDHLFELFQQPKAAYFVVNNDGVVVGGGGIFPTDGLPSDTCELVKMYLHPTARGYGFGKKLIEQCVLTAKENGFNNIYLETMPELKQALNVYEKLGFNYLSEPLGNTGHFGCGLWMLKEL
ncbi:MAG: GNAT family N-acetyltransferase [Chitinophagales bacterium]|nr:GNAT family N-acetyltransferase [Chitinophagales bacterium]